MQIETLLAQIRACCLCADRLPNLPRPILRASATARLLIVGQAPGRRVHETGIPWNDPSGDRLRDWLAIDKEAFYDTQRIAIVPTAFCYPGSGVRGDLPPSPECAPTWHPLLHAQMHEIRLTLLVGTHAQAYYLGKRRKATLAATVQAWQDYLPDYFPLPHPSPRNRLWMKRNAWFEESVVAQLRLQVAAVLQAHAPDDLPR
ncbi:MAG: uracil-DNA glycosylase family protein [Sulfuricella sp.]|nr:uracil-DNA glycosylase family protein [Sulfuricella sp.]